VTAVNMPYPENVSPAATPSERNSYNEEKSAKRDSGVYSITVR